MGGNTIPRSLAASSGSYSCSLSLLSTQNTERQNRVLLVNDKVGALPVFLFQFIENLGLSCQRALMGLPRAGGGGDSLGL